MIMEIRDRSSYPDSPHPGHRHPSDWITHPYSIVFTGVVLFILIFGIAVFLCWRQFETTRHNALTADKTTANLLADLILEHNRATIGILQSYAHRPLFIAAVKNKDLARAYRHLSDLKKNAGIDLTFVTDTRGILWANFPVFPEAIGNDLSSRDWYKGISSHWKPYISAVFKLIVGDKPLAVAVCVPIFDEKERVIGILGSSQRLGFLVYAIQKVPFSPYTAMNVIDRAGKILYSNKFSYQESITDYRFSPILEPAVKEKKQQIEMNDPQKDQEKSYLTVVPVGDIGWTVIIERSLKDIYRSEFRRFIEIGAISFLLFLLIIFFLVYLRKANLFRKTEELLQAETKLRKSEENFHHSLDDSPIGVRIVTAEGETIYANRAILTIYGYDSMEDLKTTPVEKRYTPESHADFLIRREKRQQGADVPSEYTINIIRKDGEVRHLLVLRRGILWDGERQFQVLYNDITERKRAEVALQESEERLRTIIEASLDAIIAVNVEGRLVLFNGAAQELFQYSEEEALNQPADILLREEIGHIHQEKLERFLKRGVGQCGHIGRRMEKLFRRKDGSLFEAEASMSGGRFDGLRLVVLAIHDITDRKQAENALRKTRRQLTDIIEFLPDATLAIDKEGLVIIWNKAIEEMTGVPAAEIIGKGDHAYTIPFYGEARPQLMDLVFEDNEEIAARYPQLTREGDTLIAEVFCTALYDNKGAWVIAKASPLHDQSGNIIGAIESIRDITPRKKAEEVLRESENRYRELFENMQSGVSVYETRNNGEDFIFKEYNAAAEMLDKTSRGQVIGRSVVDVFPGVKDFGLFDVFQRVYRTGKPEGHPVTFYKDKKISGWRENYVYKLPSGEIVSVFEDITDRKRAEEALSKSREQLREAYRLAQMGVWDWVAETDTVTWTEELYRIAGLDPMLPAPTYAEHPNIYAPESWDLLKEAVERAMKTGEPYNLELKLIRPDGTTRWVNAFGGVTYDSHGRIQGLYGTVQDITDRKQAGQAQVRLVAMLDATPGFVGYADAKDTHILYINSAGRKMVGVQAQEDVTRLKIADVHPEWTKKLFRDAIIPTAIRDGLWTGECAFLNREGHEIPVMMALLAHKSPSGEVERFSTVSIDITDRKQAEEEVQASHEQMRALAGRLQEVREEERTNIAREIHDELGGALTGLKIDFSLLTRVALQIENKTVRTSLLAGMDSMIKFIDATIHTVRRIAMELRPGVLDDLGLVAALEWQLKDFEKRTGIRCEFFPPVEDISFDADISTALFRIFQEALTNVARHSGATEVRVRLRMEADSSTLEVEDNGKGIEKEKALSSKSLGLLGMRERAQMFGGRITVTGTPGTGTKVTVEIPPSSTTPLLAAGKFISLADLE
jgi:PAS domain S-box-containing protein